MNRSLAVILFASGVIAAPLVSSLIQTVAKSAIAQEEGLIVIEPAPVTVDAYLELVKQKIELLTAEELALETEVLKKELAELQANRKLREAEQQLNQLIDQFPRSAAAARARIMLKTDLVQSPDSDPPAESLPGFSFDGTKPRRPERDRPSLRTNSQPLDAPYVPAAPQFRPAQETIRSKDKRD